LAHVALDDVLQLLRVGLDGALHDGGRFGIAFGQDGVKFLFADVLAVLFTERIFTAVPELFAYVIQHAPKSALAGLVANKAVFVLHFEVVTVDFDAR
jgi:hypothetical protein